MPVFDNILSSTYRKMRTDLPPLVLKTVYRLFPPLFIASIIDLAGIALIFPVIQILLDPDSVHTNKYLFSIYNFFHFTDTVSFVLFLFVIIVTFFLLKNIVIYFAYKRQTRIAFKAASTLSINKYSHYLSRSYEFFTENNTALMLRNFAQIPFEFVQFVLLPFAVIINEIFVLSIIIVVLSVVNPVLFLSIVVIAIPCGLIYNRAYRQRLRDISERRNKESAAIYKTGMQSMEGFREIVVFNKLDFFKPYFQRSVERYTRSTSNVYLLNFFSPKIVETVAVLSIAGIFVSGYLFGKDIRSLGQFLVAFTLAAYRIIPSMNRIILSGNYIKSSFFTIDHFSREEGIGEKRPAETTAQISMKEKLSIKDLSFRFRNTAEKVLDGVNLEILKGQTIGIIGPSGSGKTTLLNILLRLYKEQEGGIYIDGRKIEDRDVFAWYDLLSYVPQSITLLDGTVTENIAFGIEPGRIDRERLKKVIERAQLSDLVASLPQKEESQIGENGIKLSGGQRQRIGIARALYHGGSILIFDEATSALDSETERMVTESINSISHQELTIIIVAHRLQTLKYCDRIYKIERGRLGERSFRYEELTGEK